MAELNEKQQNLYEELLHYINVASTGNLREAMIETLDNLIEDLLKEWDNLRWKIKRNIIAEIISVAVASGIIKKINAAN